ncbi:hypothetical protein FNV43_RR19351 [Rhamnella rubrinervis]|uniref:Mitochondrial adenine nucleotide transporter BTL3 n=1 Tax=Rhamnella rubrinervis TaxID=2594499 RepID=A0A8K0E106_9ROSA|nr:hypothetical protein FNV43_RR19351 [Rhamnella rubrinervis]
MHGPDDSSLTHLLKTQPPLSFIPGAGGLFLDSIHAVPPSLVSLFSSKTLLDPVSVSFFSGTCRKPVRFEGLRGGGGGLFLSVSLSIRRREGVDNDDDEATVVYEESEKDQMVQRSRMRGTSSRAMNMTKHLWAGVVAAMVSRTFVAPLERLKMEYVVRGEQKNLPELIRTIAASQGLKGFWKGNFVNILRTAPFKSINFYAYDRYRNQLVKMSGNEETTNLQRFVAGAAAGITATLLCLPMDTIRTKMLAPGGEALGGVIGTFRHMIQAEGRRKRIQHMKECGEELNAFEQLELGTMRTLLYGAIAGACSEAATYPFEVVRRHLQMQARATKLNALSTSVKIVEQGGIPALYAGLVPSLLQVLPSAAISYFVYEFMKIVLKEQVLHLITMHGPGDTGRDLIEPQPSVPIFFLGGLFLDPTNVVPPSLFSFFSSYNTHSDPVSVSWFSGTRRRAVSFECLRGGGGGFLSASLSTKRKDGDGDDDDEGYVGKLREVLWQNGNKSSKDELTLVNAEGENEMVQSSWLKNSSAMNTSKHLWSGAASAIISRTFVAPLERLKLEYILRGEKKNLFELIKTIAASEGLKGFWKGNFVNILRTAPSKAIDFYAYDTFKNQLAKMSGNDETSNFQRFLAGAAAGVMATLLCLPMDTLFFTREDQNEDGLAWRSLGWSGQCFPLHNPNRRIFSLYQGLAPTIISMAPASAVFYGVYDILKSAYIHSPEGRKRTEHMKQSQELSALEQLELGPIRTLLYGAIAGACSETAIYPLDVLRKQLQMQAQSTRLSAMSTCLKIVEQGGVPALYAGLVPSLLQVLPAAAISYFVYEFMKIVLKVESS